MPLHDCLVDRVPAQKPRRRAAEGDRVAVGEPAAAEREVGGEPAPGGDSPAKRSRILSKSVEPDLREQRAAQPAAGARDGQEQVDPAGLEQEGT